MKENVVLAAVILGAAIIVAAGMLRATQSHPLSTSPCDCSPRFQVSVGANHAIIIDTSTGRTWETYLASNTGTIDDDFRKTKVDTGR